MRDGRGIGKVHLMRVLVVEDEARFAALLRRDLLDAGHAVDLVDSGEAALERLVAGGHEAVVLDATLPGMDGFEICRRLRQRRVQVPVLLLATPEIGADDYLLKPFAPAELAERLRALGRRRPAPANAPLVAADVRLDPAECRVWKGADEVRLTNKEFRILEQLMRHPGRVLTRTRIAEHVWGGDSPNATNVIDVHIRQIRRKLGDACPGTLIQTVRGSGYRLTPDG